MVGGQVIAPNYRADPPNGYPLRSNINFVTGIPKLSFSETVFDMVCHPVPSGRRPMLCQKPKPIPFMGYLVRIFTEG